MVLYSIMVVSYWPHKLVCGRGRKFVSRHKETKIWPAQYTMPNSSWIILLSWLVNLPERCRTEGRITLNYPYNDQVYRYNLAFTESIDAYDLRSVISIGYVGYDPVQYYTRKDSPTITVNSDGICQPLSSATYFVAEINWFARKVLDIPMAQFSAESPHMVGPTGLFGAINSMSKSEVSSLRLDNLFISK